MEHRTMAHSSAGRSPDVLSDDDERSRASLSPVFRVSTPACVTAPSRDEVRRESRGSTPLDHYAPALQIYRPEPLRAEQISPPRSCSTPTPQGHNGLTLHLNNNNNNNDNNITDNGQQQKSPHHKNNSTSKSFSKPSFMINDILSDKHPTKSRTSRKALCQDRHHSSPIHSSYPGDLPHIASNTAVAAAALLGHQQRLSQLAAINSPRSRHSPPDSFPDLAAQHFNGHHFPASLDHHQQQQLR